MRNSWSFFLLRGGEWLAHDGRGYDPAKVVLGGGVKGYREGSLVGSLADAAEVAVEVRASKVDQHNIGTWRNHFASGEETCPVLALANLQRAHPERFGSGPGGNRVDLIGAMGERRHDHHPAGGTTRQRGSLGHPNQSQLPIQFSNKKR